MATSPRIVALCAVGWIVLLLVAGSRVGANDVRHRIGWVFYRCLASYHLPIFQDLTLSFALLFCCSVALARPGRCVDGFVLQGAVWILWSRLLWRVSSQEPPRPGPIWPTAGSKWCSRVSTTAPRTATGRSRSPGTQRPKLTGACSPSRPLRLRPRLPLSHRHLRIQPRRAEEIEQIHLPNPAINERSIVLSIFVIEIVVEIMMLVHLN